MSYIFDNNRKELYKQMEDCIDTWLKENINYKKNKSISRDFSNTEVYYFSNF